MDKITQVKVNEEINLKSLQSILKTETEVEAKVKIKKVNHNQHCIVQQLPTRTMFRQLDCGVVQGPSDLVRFWNVGGGNGCQDISTLVNSYDEFEVKGEPKVEDTQVKMIEPQKYSISSNCPPTTLVRGSSLSLVEIPTFLSSSVTLGTISSVISHSFPLYDPRKTLAEKLAKYRAKQSEQKMGKRSQWTVMCVALGFFSSCLILVGGMLSYTSDYQDRTIARMLNMSIYRVDSSYMESENKSGLEMDCN
jgi:hypothetical protein